MRPNHPPGPQPPVIARCLNGSAFLGGSASFGPVDTLQSRSTHSTQMDKLEKSHEETKVFCRLTPILLQPAMSAVKITDHIRNLLLCGPSKSTQLSWSLALVNRL